MQNMSTNGASSSAPDIASSGTDIRPNKATNHTQSSNKSTQSDPTHNVNEKGNEKPASGVDRPKEKSQSTGGGFLRNLFKSRKKPPENNSNDGPRPNVNNRSYSEVKALLNMVEADLKVILNARERMDDCKDHIKTVTEKLEELKTKCENPEELEKLKGENGNVNQFRQLKKNVKKLKQQISSKQKDENRSLREIDTDNNNRANADNALDQMLDLYNNAAFEKSLTFKELEARYHGLEDELKLCLLCFSVFPENAEIKKRVMIYWWIGEGFVPPIRMQQSTNENTVVQDTNESPVVPQQNANESAVVQKTAERFAKDFFEKLIAKGFIEPVHEKRSLGVDICKIHPLVRSMVIKLAMRASFFDFDEKGNVKAKHSRSLRACLTAKESAKIPDLETLHALFNVNETILQFKPEWFSKMKNVNVLYLGRWQTSATHHIEVEDTETMKKKNANVLDGLENVKHLKFLSLQGISRIMELPKSISKLKKLTILDLRACHNLEVIPNEIGLLKNLTHLDMSECYLLDQMPKGLALLSELEVLSGFVVGDSKGKNSCTLEDLRKLIKLRKLSIHTGVNEFPLKRHLSALNQFKKLSKLTIAWGRGSVQAKKDVTGKQDNSEGNMPAAGTQNREDGEGSKKKGKSAAEHATAAANESDLPGAPTEPSTSKQSAGTQDREDGEGSKKKGKSAAEPGPDLPSQLIKLDLQCFPGMIAPSWLSAGKLNSLEKLYIRGGKFSDLGQFQGAEKDKWKVVDLRLKYLTELEMDWRERLELFPNLNYLEKVECPKLTFFPCDESGVWMKKKN